jgi:hypothetical protein
MHDEDNDGGFPGESPAPKAPTGWRTSYGSARAASCTSGGRTWTRHGITTSAARCAVDGGPDEQALAALEARDSGSLNRVVPEPTAERLQLRDDPDAALAHLREVRDKYWDHDWRREHRGHGRYPENELRDAVEGFLDLLDASRASKPDT